VTRSIALLADIHANLEALRSCLDHARAHGAARYAFLGDLVGYGADPGAVLDIVAEHASRGALVVRGNHDEAVSGASGYLNETAAAAIAWTRTVVTPAHRRFLESLPLTIREDFECFVHASAAAPERWDYVDSAGAAERSARAAERTYTFCGHVHHQMLYGEDSRLRMVAFRPRAGVSIPVSPRRAWLAIAGSVGQSRDGNPAASYALADLDGRTITFHRVPYDTAAAARKIREAGLPEILAHRLERGA
jgi:diadenosine tetraphosphatase ApaH/serine/threonine PP2A family protein phosphatase